MKIKSMKKIKNLTGKKIFLRSDFNVPIEKGKILEDFKIVSSLSTIRFLSRYGAKVIIATHLGEPDGADEKFSVKPVAEKLNSLLHQEVRFVNDIAGFRAGNAVSKMKNGDILVLENLRFEKGEEENDQSFAKKLSLLADIYVNNAFAVCHRKHASVCAIKRYLPAYAGLLLEKEVEKLHKVLNPEKPLIAVIGGVKAETKIGIMKNIAPKAEKILIGGALANSFLKSMGFEIGESVYDEESFDEIKKVNKNKLIFPIDAVVKSKRESGIKIKKIGEISKGDFIFDIGPETIKLFCAYIKKARTIVWNGPMGKFEEDRFRHGTLIIGRAIASHSKGSVFGVAGGGETIEALNKTSMQNYMDWISTGGGAMLAYLSGEKMPGLEKIVS